MLRGLIDDWRLYLGDDQDLPAEEIKKATRTGRPVGDGHFIETMERLTGRNLCKQKQGRRPKSSL